MRISLFALVCALALPSSLLPAQDRLAIVGAVVIDTADRGRSTRDIEDAVIVVENGVITAVGPQERIAVPEGFRIVEGTGKFVVPGLVDGFAVLNNQAYANAFLHSGVTSILAVSGGRRGPLFTRAKPSPHLYPLEDVGYESAPIEKLLTRVDDIADEGARVALLMYRLTPDKLRLVAQRCRERGLATIGELALTTYEQGMDMGLDAFVHTTRYSLGMAPEELRLAVAKEPFSDDLASPKWRWYKWLSAIRPDNPRLARYAKALGHSETYILPTAGLLALHHPWSKNPWTEPAAVLLDPKDINQPADPETGKQAHDVAHREAYARLAAATEIVEKAYHSAGARYLAGSGCDVWGSMPGISLVWELDALVRYGLTPREALAAATSSFADAFGWKELGEVRPGRRADLLLLDQDPRADIRAIRSIATIVLGGRLIDRAKLLTLPEDGKIVEREAFAPSAEEKSTPGLDEVGIERITYLSDGLRVKGWLLTPKAPGPHPAIVYCRGGNREFGALDEKRVLGRLLPMARWGYVVVASQYRGVAGGEGLEEFGGAEVNDVLALLPLLDSLPEADSDRIGLYGSSRGGMMSLLTISRTDRFRALVLKGPVTDLIRWKKDRPGIEEVYEELIPGYDKEGDAVLLPRSPARWPEKLSPKTPILLMQGGADWRVPPGSAFELAEGLQALHRTLRFVLFEGADHGLTEKRKEARALAHEWFDRFVRDRSPLPDTRPHGR